MTKMNNSACQRVQPQNHHKIMTLAKRS